MCGKWQRTDSIKEFQEKHANYRMSIRDFCEAIRNETYVKANLKNIVIIGTDINKKEDGRWEAVVFTTIGKGFVFLKVVEMYREKGAITGLIDGTNILQGIFRALTFGHSDYEHKF